jgi:citrate lyase synthetase
LSGEKEIISATSVRKAMQEENMSRIEELCPESTVVYLKEQLSWKG